MSDVGGLLGLFMGFSFVSAIEILYHAFRVSECISISPLYYLDISNSRFCRYCYFLKLRSPVIFNFFVLCDRNSNGNNRSVFDFTSLYTLPTSSLYIRTDFRFYYSYSGKYISWFEQFIIANFVFIYWFFTIQILGEYSYSYTLLF